MCVFVVTILDLVGFLDKVLAFNSGNFKVLEILESHSLSPAKCEFSFGCSSKEMYEALQLFCHSDVSFPVCIFSLAGFLSLSESLLEHSFVQQRQHPFNGPCLGLPR